jgi:hypothetical protein
MASKEQTKVLYNIFKLYLHLISLISSLRVIRMMVSHLYGFSVSPKNVAKLPNHRQFHQWFSL